MSLLYGVLKDEETQQEFRITKKCVRIGRGENCDLSYDSSEYGHAEINVYTTFQLFITNCVGTSCVLLNREPVSVEPIPLRSGDSVQVGERRFTFIYPSGKSDIVRDVRYYEMDRSLGTTCSVESTISRQPESLLKEFKETQAAREKQKEFIDAVNQVYQSKKTEIVMKCIRFVDQKERELKRREAFLQRFEEQINKRQSDLDQREEQLRQAEREITLMKKNHFKRMEQFEKRMEEEAKKVDLSPTETKDSVPKVESKLKKRRL